MLLIIQKMLMNILYIFLQVWFMEILKKALLMMAQLPQWLTVR